MQLNPTILLAEKFGEEWRVYRKDYLLDESGKLATTLPKSIWMDNEISNHYGKQSVKELLGTSVVDFPKAPELIKKLLKTGTSHSDIVLDFFAGSVTTAHAVMELNKEDDGNRQYIMVQLPEPRDEQSEAFKAGYKTIADIGKERIRQAAKKIKKEQKNNLDFTRAD